MYKFVNFDLEREMDKAYDYLALNLRETGHNSKPVLMHSIAVSMTLYELGYSREIVISSILHDLIEDTDVEYKDILQNFDKKIADIVQSLSFDSNIADKIERTNEVFSRISKQGYEAKIVKCADLYSNMPFIKFVENIELKKYLTYKYSTFIQLFGNELKNEPIYKKYLIIYNELIKNRV